LLLDDYGEGNIPAKMQSHHKLSVNAVRTGTSNLAQLLRARGKAVYDIDQKGNLRNMPGAPDSFSGNNKAKGDLLHRGQHPNWDRHVDQVMAQQEEAIKTQFCVGNLNQLTNEQLNEAMGDLQDLLGQELKQVNSDINKLKPGEEPKKGSFLEEVLQKDGNPNGWVKDHPINGTTYYKLSKQLESDNALS
jgi:hypothetical protein